MKGLISALGIYENVAVECNPDYILGNYDTILEDTLIYRPVEATSPDSSPTPPIQVQYFYTCRLLVLRTEEEFQSNIANEFKYTNGCGNPVLNPVFSMSRLIDWNYDPALICEQIKTRIFRAIDRIEFKPIILDTVDKIHQRFVTNAKTLGVSVRTWKGVHETNLNIANERSYDPAEIKRKIRSIMKENDIRTVVISFDNHVVEPEYVKFLHETCGDVKVIVLHKNGCNELQSAIVKVLALSKCDYFIGTRISTFSELVFWFSRCGIDVRTVG